MAVTRLVPSTSKVVDKVTRDELNKVYNQFNTLIDIIRQQQEKINELEGKINA